MKKKIIGISICVLLDIIAVVIFFLKYKDNDAVFVIYLGILIGIIGIIGVVFEEDLLRLEVKYHTKDGTEPSNVRRVESKIGVYSLSLFPLITLIIVLCTFK